MKRDMDLIRNILIRAETASYGTLSEKDFSDAGFEEQIVVGHFKLLEEAGLVEAEFLTLETLGVVGGTVSRLTWSGHDYLDTIRNETVWKRTKKLVSEKAGSVPFSIIQTIAAKFLLAQLNLDAE